MPVIVIPITRPSGYNNRADAGQMALAHLGSVSERQTATQEHVAHEEEHNDHQEGCRLCVSCDAGVQLSNFL